MSFESHQGSCPIRSIRFHRQEADGNRGRLFIRYALVERYGGRITAKSTGGQGAQFIVWLREDVAAAAAEPDDRAS